jgi:hypothetical protein
MPAKTGAIRQARQNVQPASRSICCLLAWRFTVLLVELPDNCLLAPLAGTTERAIASSAQNSTDRTGDVVSAPTSGRPSGWHNRCLLAGEAQLQEASWQRQTEMKRPAAPQSTKPCRPKKMASTGGAGTCGGTRRQRASSHTGPSKYVQKRDFGKRRRPKSGNASGNHRGPASVRHPRHAGPLARAAYPSVGRLNSKNQAGTLPRRPACRCHPTCLRPALGSCFHIG